MGKPLGGDRQSHKRSRDKGARYEIEISHALSRVIYGRENVIRRTPLSGGWSGMPSGDLIVDGTMLKGLERPPRIFVECKTRAGFSLSDVLPIGKGNPWVLSTWIQILQDAPSGAEPLLIVRGGWPDSLAITRTAPFAVLPGLWRVSFSDRGNGDFVGWPFKATLRLAPGEFAEWALGLRM